MATYADLTPEQKNEAILHSKKVVFDLLDSYVTNPDAAPPAAQETVNAVRARIVTVAQSKTYETRPTPWPAADVVLLRTPDS